MTTLLDDDGTASMATCLMSSHHAFRRDVACFVRALAAPIDSAKADALRFEWNHLHTALHSHHTVEDTAMFPAMRAAQPELAPTFDQLEGHHRQIDPLIARGDELFAALPARRLEARELVSALADLLATHLELEERAIISNLRGAKEFPPPPDEAALAMYADGFAWSTAGLAPVVIEQIDKLLPAGLVERLPAARQAFDERCRKAWGAPHATRSLTSIPA